MNRTEIRQHVNKTVLYPAQAEIQEGYAWCQQCGKQGTMGLNIHPAHAVKGFNAKSNQRLLPTDTEHPNFKFWYIVAFLCDYPCHDKLDNGTGEKVKERMFDVVTDIFLQKNVVTIFKYLPEEHRHWFRSKDMLSFV